MNLVNLGYLLTNDRSEGNDTLVNLVYTRIERLAYICTNNKAFNLLKKLKIAITWKLNIALWQAGQKLVESSAI